MQQKLKRKVSVTIRCPRLSLPAYDRISEIPLNPYRITSVLRRDRVVDFGIGVNKTEKLLGMRSFTQGIRRSL